jgi:hypothetical protein
VGAGAVDRGDAAETGLLLSAKTIAVGRCQPMQITQPS